MTTLGVRAKVGVNKWVLLSGKSQMSKCPHHGECAPQSWEAFCQGRWGLCALIHNMDLFRLSLGLHHQETALVRSLSWKCNFQNSQ